MRQSLVLISSLAIVGPAKAEGICEVFIDDETLVRISEAQQLVAVERRYEHCTEVDTGESVSEARTVVAFTEFRSFDGRPTVRFAKTSDDLALLKGAFGGDGAELREASALASALKTGAFAVAKAGAKSPAGCVASLGVATPAGESDPGIYTVRADVRDSKGASVLTKELGAASEGKSKRTTRAKFYWAASAKTLLVEVHMPQRRVLGDAQSKTVAAGRVVVLSAASVVACFPK